ncbi:MAG: RimK family alpha-L-glutamate ligase [Euryarchaeota archaeon]|nr:RimK family alpha-L-glutamate ligase [Euryarchaeota archaeon]
MHIAILSRKRTLHSTSNLMRAALERDHDVSVIDPMRCNLSMGKGEPRIYHEGETLTDIDVVIPRIGASITTYGLAVVSHFDMMGVPVVNSPAGIFRSRDKLRSMQILSRMDIDMPRTYICRRPEDIDAAIRYCGGFPIILKLHQGTQGVGVMIADSRDSAESILDIFFSMGHIILIQQFIKESRGKDIRALVLGDQVCAAMKREARMGEFRSNIHRGGTGRVVRLSDEEERVAIQAAAVLGINIAGVDMLMGKDGPKVIEVNSSPGFEGLEAATGRDIAGDIIDFTIDYAERARRGEIAEPPRIG